MELKKYTWKGGGGRGVVYLLVTVPFCGIVDGVLRRGVRAIMDHASAPCTDDVRTTPYLVMAVGLTGAHTCVTLN